MRLITKYRPIRNVRGDEIVYLQIKQITLTRHLMKVTCSYGSL